MKGVSEIDVQLWCLNSLHSIPDVERGQVNEEETKKEPQVALENLGQAVPRPFLYAIVSAAIT